MGNSDVGERLLLLFRKSGPTVVSVGGYNLSYSDLIKMRSDRNMCNEFMRKCTDLAIGNLTKVLVEENKKAIGTDKKKEQDRQKQLMQIADMRASLLEKMRKPRFFEGGVKMDDLVDFKVWQIQADRLGIKLLEED